MQLPLHAEVTHALTAEQVEQLITHLLRLPDVFAAARPHLNSMHFDMHHESGPRLLWLTALKVAKECGPAVLFGEPTAARALLEVEGNALADQSQLIPEVLAEIFAPVMDFSPQPGLLHRVFDKPAGELNQAYGMDLLRRFLVERGIARPIAGHFKVTEKTIPADITGLLRKAVEKEQIYRHLGASAGGSFEDEWAAFDTHLNRYRGRQLIGLRTGMAQFDERLSGARDVMVLAAGPGVGKTMYALQLGKGVARHWDANNAIFVMVSLEMPRQAMYIRLLCGQAGLDWRTVTQGSESLRGRPSAPWFTPAHQALLDQAQQELRTSGITRRTLILDRETLGGEMTVAGLLALISAFKAQVGATRALIAIDYLQLLPVPEKVVDLEADRHRVRFVQELLAGTKSAASPDGDAVLVISEARKPSSGKSKNWAGSAADLMGSARIAYAADAILLYHTMDEDEVVDHAWPVQWDAQQSLAALQQEGIAPVKLTLAKGRDGMRRGSWAMAFHFEQARFTEVVGGPAGAPHVHTSYIVPPSSLPGGIPNGSASNDGVPNGGGADGLYDTDMYYS